ncbi:LCP family protein [Desulfofundulus thermobenzoicus]|nr:LCP family protein [Desulfofundulus thermobenzoicus]
MIRRRRRRRPGALLLVLALLCLGGGGLLLAGYLGLWPAGLPAGPGNAVEAGQSPGSFTVLLLGTDARPGEKVGRTDTIIVANVDGDKKRISLLSIPRDTRVYIPGHGTDKINAAAVYGGPALTAETVSSLIGMPVQYYALARWEGFKKIVDVLGGVTIDVEKDMIHYDPEYRQYSINLRKGEQRLDGDKALQYVRFRSDALGDIGRTERQLKFLKALAAEVMRPSTLLKIPRLVPEINNSLETNLGPRQMLAMAQAARYFEQAQVITQTLPGRFLDLNGISYWSVEPYQARQVARAFFNEGQVTDTILGSVVINNQNASQEAAGGDKAQKPDDSGLPDNNKQPPAVSPGQGGKGPGGPGKDKPVDGRSGDSPAGSTSGRDGLPSASGGTGAGSAGGGKEGDKNTGSSARDGRLDQGGGNNPPVEIIPVPPGETGDNKG